MYKNIIYTSDPLITARLQGCHQHALDARQSRNHDVEGGNSPKPGQLRSLRFVEKIGDLNDYDIPSREKGSHIPPKGEKEKSSTQVGALFVGDMLVSSQEEKYHPWNKTCHIIGIVNLVIFTMLAIENSHGMTPSENPVHGYPIVGEWRARSPSFKRINKQTLKHRRITKQYNAIRHKQNPLSLSLQIYIYIYIK